MKKSKIIFSIGRGYRRIHAIDIRYTENSGYWKIKVMSEREAFTIAEKLNWTFGKTEWNDTYFNTFYDQSSHRIYRYYEFKQVDSENLFDTYCEFKD